MLLLGLLIIVVCVFTNYCIYYQLGSGEVNAYAILAS